LRVDMYMVLHGKRYHHRHYFNDYLLFNVDTTPAIGKSKEILGPSVESNP
jgi:hypothetical protein